MIRYWRLLSAVCVGLWLCGGSVAAPAGAQNAAGSARGSSPESLRNEAFMAAQWAVASEAASALTQMSARFAAQDDALGQLVRDRQDAVEAWRANEDRLVKALAGEGAAGADAQELRKIGRELQAKINTLDAKINEAFPRYAALTLPNPLTIEEVQNLLREDEALLNFLVTNDATYIWAISAEKSAWTRVSMTAADLSAKITRLREDLDPTLHQTRAGKALFGKPSPGAKGPTFPRQAAFDLYTNLLSPLEDVIRDKPVVFTVADGALTSLPLAVLVTEQPIGEDSDVAALRSTEWFVKRHAAVTLPAVSSLKALRSLPERDRAKAPFIGFGDPVLGAEGPAATRGVSTYFEGRLANVEAVRALSRLPETARELRRMAGALQAPAEKVILGDKATEAQVKAADLEPYSVIAFATHGLLAGELQGLSEPALVFTPPKEATLEDDGLLTASEAAQLRLNADWVVLSACNTAASDGTPGAEGLSGLARAFLYAGARSILVSHWPVRDDAAAALTTEAFALMRENPELDRARAFQQSILTLMASDAAPGLAHPSSWAPFVIVGDVR